MYAVQHLRSQKDFKFTATTIEESLKRKLKSKGAVQHVSMARFNPENDTFVPEEMQLNSMILAMYTAHVNNLPFKLYPHDVWLMIVQGMSHVSKTETGFYDEKLFKKYDRSLANFIYRGKRKRVKRGFGQLLRKCFGRSQRINRRQNATVRTPETCHQIKRVLQTFLDVDRHDSTELNNNYYHRMDYGVYGVCFINCSLTLCMEEAIIFALW